LGFNGFRKVALLSLFGFSVDFHLVAVGKLHDTVAVKTIRENS
jgi:hypothetical protein